MSEIEVGEYIRTNKGLIARIIDFDDDNNFLLDNQQIITKIESKSIKHSKNIIDLIEVGDYVNGHRIDNIINGVLVHRADGIDRSGFLIPIAQYNNDIKSIVTKEEFESREYKVGV